MGESATVSTLPPTLEARPPTPPRESSHDKKQTSLLSRFLHSNSTRRSSAPVPSTYTPDSSAESPSTSGSSRKKVGFSEWPQYNDPPTVSFDGKGVLKHVVQPLPPSSERKPSKSILKAHNGNQEHESLGIEGSNTALLPLHHYATFAKMLESIIQQLAGRDRSCKVDAYLMLSGALKASDNVPDPKALKDQIGKICGYIERDLSQKLENGKPDSTLIVNAITVLGCFLHKSAIADSLPTDFTIRFLDYTIHVLNDGSMSKEVTKHLMFILAQQKFSTGVMSRDRVGRLVMALHEIEEKIKGKSIVQSRLQIYRTLLRQSGKHMTAHTIWIEDLLTDMLSSLKDIRATAITVGLEAGFSLGREAGVSKTVQNIFKKEVPGGEDRFGDYYIARLKTAIKNKEEPSTIPQIWSVVVLLLRSSSIKVLEQWQFFPQFLNVLSACFNIADNSVRTEAHYAWNRFIFVVQPNEKTSPKLRGVLFQGLATQLERKSASGRKKALSGIHTLLYYALNPRSTPAQLEMYWDEYLVPLIEDCLCPAKKESPATEMSKQNAIDACLILQCLFDTTTPRKWSENRTMDNLLQNGLEAQELPALDSRWLRKNHIRVFGLLNPLLRKLYWDFGDNSAITKVWQSYITSIASPAAMEVKVSFDTMSCIASIFSTIHTFWGIGPATLGDLSASTPKNKHLAFWKGLETILKISVDGLGLLPFTDKTLSIKHDSYIAVATPSHQPSKVRLETRSPLHHLISIFSNPSPNLVFDNGFLQMVHTTLLPFFDNKTSKQAQIDFVKQLTVLLPTVPAPSVASLWQVLADFAIKAIDIREKSDVVSTEAHLGHNYRSIVNVLETGVLLSPQRLLPRWKVLFDALVVSAAIDAGDSGKAIAVIEPLAKTFRSQRSSSGTEGIGLAYLSTLLGKVSYPKDRQALDAAERKLWGSKQSNAKITSYDPYVDLYAYIGSALESAYRAHTKTQVHENADAISAVTGLLNRCPTRLLSPVLRNLQSSISLWIADLDSKLTGGNALGLAIIALWGTICKLIPTLFDTSTFSWILSEHEILICAGLESKHKTIVNSTIVMWNSTFGTSQDSLEYPPKAKEALLRLHPVVELQLPFFPNSLQTDDVSTGHRQPASLIGQHEESQFSGFSVDSVVNGHLASRPELRGMERLRRTTPQVVIGITRAGSLKRSREGTPDVGRRYSKRRDVTPRVRHDDSQVQFEAIPSSSPGFDKNADSQILTEKQKEVRERQHADAAMFPDLRSSPRPRGRLPESEDAEMELPIHRSSSKIREMISRGTDRETTPNVAIPSDDENNYVASSPTPTRSLRAQIEDPPSSPPEASSKRRDLISEDQISSSPPEGSPEPSHQANTSDSAPVDPSMVAEEVQEIPSPTHAGTPEIEGQAEDDILVKTTEANTNEDGMESNDKVDVGANATDNVTEDDAEDNDDLSTTTRPSREDLSAGNDTTGSILHSAQIDPNAIEMKLTASTDDLPTSDRSSSPAENPSDQLRASQLEYEAALLQESSFVKSTLEFVPSSIANLGVRPVYDPQVPGTPRRIEPEAEQQTPNTPHFVDALSSPGSDGQVFEDAISSPRVNVRKAPPAQASFSSPLSDIDERSMLRIVAEFDETSSGQVSSIDDKENRPRRTRSSVSKETASATVSAPTPLRRTALRKKSGLAHSSQSEQEIPSEGNQLQTSSVPSLIPETPAPKGAEPEKLIEQSAVVYRDDDGNEINMDETIIVDASILEREGYRTHKRSPRKKSRKRKLPDDHVDTDEVLGSQGCHAEEESQSQSQGDINLVPAATTPASPSKKPASPAKKKRRGRPSKALQRIAGLEGSQDSGASHSFTSVDQDTSMAEMEDSIHKADLSIIDNSAILEMEKTEELPSEIEEEVMQGTKASVEKSSDDTNPVDRTRIEEDIVMDTILPEPSTQDMDVIAETTFGDNSSAERSSSSSREPEIQTSEQLATSVGIETAQYGEDDHDPASEENHLHERVCAEEGCKSAVVENEMCNECGAAREEIDMEARIASQADSSPAAAVQEISGGVELDGVNTADVPENIEGVDNRIVHEGGPRIALGSTVEEKPAVTLQNMKDKLQSLITDLHGAALNRQEINELEDMFMDAKRALYGVELRGRQATDV